MDERFEIVKRDHRFRPIRQTQRKIQIDKRFYGLFYNKKFQENFTVDKRGRPTRESTTKNLRKFYHLSKAERKRIHKDRMKERENLQKQLEEEDDVPAKKTKNEIDEDPGEDGGEREEDSDSSYISSDEDSDIDLARGKGNVESSSEEESDGEFNFEQDEKDIPDHSWGEIDNEAPRSQETSSRLALCSMDWDRVKAADIFVLLDSFKPPGGVIKSIIIYPSEFGIERMKGEERSGPAELKEMKSTENEWTKDDDTNFNTEKLRQYQLNRLKYYYAVVTCDSVKTAGKIYNECDGIEFETSSSKLDLRFIPDGMEFKDHPPKEELLSAPDLATYKPVSFITAALNQTKVGLTWDETDHKRTTLTRSKFTKDDLENMDVKDFLASGSESENDSPAEEEIADGVGRKMDEKERADMYRKLLLGEDTEKKEEDNDDVDMEITWEPDLKEEVEEDVAGGKKKNNKKKKEMDKNGNDETSQAELEMIMLDDDGNSLPTSGGEFKIDVNDDRFSAMYKSSRYAIDQSDSSYRKSEGMSKLLQERQERLKQTNGSDVIDNAKDDKNSLPSITKPENGLAELVKSVKSKSAWLGRKSKK